MKTRIFPNLRRALVLLIIIPTVLSGCSWYFYMSEPVRKVLFFDSFDDTNLYNRWDPWTAAGGTAGDGDFFATPLWGRVEVFGRECYLTSHDTFVADYSVELEWSVTNGDVETQDRPMAVENAPDFTIRIDAIDTTVALWLYNKDTDTGEAEDRLEIYREGGVFLSEAAIPTQGIERGTLVVDFEVRGERAYVSGRVPELGLESEDSVAFTATDQDHPITIGASGLWSDPRSLETVFVYRINSGLEVFE
jgi:hypothetical protein